MSDIPLLEVRDLVLEMGQGSENVRLLDGVSFTLRKGETLGLVGESGSGKSLTASSLARLTPSPPARYSGQILVNGRDVFSMASRELRRLRGGVISYVFQEPASVLNPVLRVGTQIIESLRLHRPEAAGPAEVHRWLKRVGIPSPEKRARQYPHELSGGMQQRAVIAMALASQPDLLIADEPTTALDVTIQAQILDLLRDLQQQFGMGILLITHNLGIISEMAGRVLVMYAGQIVESGAVEDVLGNPLHPYTRALLASVPSLQGNRDRLLTIPGQVPSPREFPSGCRFHPRCDQARPDCSECMPILEEISGSHLARCPYSKVPA